MRTVDLSFNFKIIIGKDKKKCINPIIHIIIWLIFIIVLHMIKGHLLFYYYFSRVTNRKEILHLKPLLTIFRT